MPFISPSISTRGKRSSKALVAAAPPLPPEPPCGIVARTSADWRVGSGGGLPSTFSNSLWIVARSCGLRSPRRSLILEPANNFTITRVLVALVRTAALEFLSPPFRKSMRLRSDKPAIPNSERACSIHPNASASALGALILLSGSYASNDVSEHHRKHRIRYTYIKSELQ